MTYSLLHFYHPKTYAVSFDRATMKASRSTYCHERLIFTKQIFATNMGPLQFNYLSYELFLEKKSCQTPKKKKKKVIFGVLRTKVVLKFSVRLQKKKKKVQVLRIFFVSVIQSTTGSYHCCSRASDMRRYTSHPSGYRN